nr:hypothetical protein [uncultured Sphingomonas sp.]
MPNSSDKSDARVDPVRAEQIGPRCPGRIGDGEALGVEFDPERREIQLEIAADAHLAVGHPPDDRFERPLQEPALGDEQHQPDERGYGEDGDDRVAQDMAPPPRVARAGVGRGLRRGQRGLPITLRRHVHESGNRMAHALVAFRRSARYAPRFLPAR